MFVSLSASLTFFLFVSSLSIDDLVTEECGDKLLASRYSIASLMPCMSRL